VKFRLVAFDLDGVLVEEPSAWWTLHHAFGSLKASKENLLAYELGAIDYPEFMRRDIRLWGNRTIHEVENVLLKFTLSEGAPETCDLLHQRGYQLAIISAGIDILARAISEKLGIEYWTANGLKVNSQNFLTGEGIYRVELKAKEYALNELIKPLGVSLSDVVGVGDSKYDLSFMRACGTGVALVKSGSSGRTHSWVTGWIRMESLRDLPDILSAIEE
jgi:phosphoserine phosphatase